MNRWKGKARFHLALVLVFVLLAQIILPSALGVVFAEEEENIEGEVQDLEEQPAESEPQEEQQDLEAEPSQEEAVKKEEIPEEDNENKAGRTSKAIGAMPFGIGPQKDLGNIFTFESMKINNEPIEDGDFITIEEGTQAELKFAWNTEDVVPPAQSGDTASLRLAETFKQVNITTPRQILVEDVHVGDYTVIDGVVQFVFNENITQDNVQNGFLELGLNFNLEKFREDRRQEIPFEHSEDQNITITARPNLNHSGITKEGHPDGTGEEAKHDAREIRWSVDVINTNDDPITEAQLLDTPPDGLGEARDFVIRKLTVDFDGNIIEGDIVSIPADGFPVELGTIAAYEGYRIEFVTTIEDYSETSFKNDAVFKYDDTELPADATVGGLTRSNPIEKAGERVTGTSVGEDRIRWTIDVNKTGQPITEAIVEDALPGGLMIDEDSIEVYKIIQQGDNWVRGGDHPDTFTKFPMNLGQLSENDTYRIVFETTVDWSEVNEGEYLEENGFENIATLFDGDTALNDDDAEVTVSRPSMLEKAGVDNVDYNNKTITWTVTLNAAKHPLDDVTVTDYLPEGVSLDLTATPPNLTITGDGDGDFSEIIPTLTEVTDGEHAGKTRLEISLQDVGTETITITYTTDIKNFTADGFTNVVGIDGDGIGEWGDPREIEINPAANTYTKNFAGINYGEKTIDWSITVDPVREGIKEGFVLTDTFTNDGLLLDPDTLQVYLGDTKLEDEGDTPDYVLAPIDGHYKNGFTITFNIPIEDAELVVIFTTSYNPDAEVIEHSNEEEPGRYVNHVSFVGETENGHDIDEEDDADHKVLEESWDSGKKEGRLVYFDGEGNEVNGWVSGSERRVAWEFYFNYHQQNLGTDVVIYDELQYAGEIDEDSVKVYGYTVDADGNTTIHYDQLIEENNYDLDVDGRELILTFTNDFIVNDRYVITFNTSVPNRSAGTYTNDAIVTVDGGEPWEYRGTVSYSEYEDFLNKSAVGTDGKQVYTGDEVNWQVRVNESLSIIENAVITDVISAGHVYLNDSLKIFRLVDETEVPLEEKEDDEDTGGDYTLEVNDLEDGRTELVIDLTDNLEHTLILRYTTVVTETDGTIGNKISLKGSDVVIDSIESEELRADEFSRVGGTWSRSTRGALQVTKIDAETEEVIENNIASFTLWYELNNEWVQFGDTVYETKNGVIEVENLQLRTYRLVEEDAPKGYVLSEDNYIEIDVTTPFGTDGVYAEGTFENTKEKTNITAEKIWEGGPQPTIWFKLYRQVEGGELEEVPETEAEIKELSNGAEEVTWEGLDVTDIDGNEYIYSVREVNAEENDFTPENYEKQENGLTVTNIYTSPKKDISATKVWVDGPEEKPTVWFKLYRQIENGGLEEVEDAETKELADGLTEVTWEDLDVTDFDGNDYIYSVKEVDAEGNDFTPEYYEKAENGLKVTNYYVSPTDASAKAIKEWVDGPSERPTIWFKLYRQVEGGELEEVPEGEAEIKELASGTTEVVWTGLTKTDPAGNDYTFSVKEVDQEGNDFTPENYSKTVSEDGLTITNTYHIPIIDVTGTKEWVGGPSQRPTIELQLFKDGEAYGESVALENGRTEYTWAGLEATDIHGKVYVYTVDEVEVPEHYEKTLSEDGRTVTNTYISPVEDPEDPTKNPKTGDRNPIGVWLAGLGISIAGLAVLAFTKKKKPLKS